MEAYVHGSQVAAHTWHHGMMTTLDTMTAIAELGYSRDIITVLDPYFILNKL